MDSRDSLGFCPRTMAVSSPPDPEVLFFWSRVLHLSSRPAADLGAMRRNPFLRTSSTPKPEMQGKFGESAARV